MSLRTARESPSCDWGVCIRLPFGSDNHTGGVHEMGIAAEIYRIARGAADGRGGGPLESVTVVIGELVAVEPDLLEFAWQATVEGTADAPARLIVDWRAARQTCSRCGEIRERVPGSWLRLCPRCQEPLAVSGGDELDVRTVAFSDGPSAAAKAG